jgi:hypothetical protein
MSRSHALRQAVLLALLLAGSAGASAQGGPTPAPPERDRQHEELPDSVRRVERQTGGEVLRAEPMQRDGREVYRFKVLTADGRVRVMQDDPNTRRDDGADRGHDDGAGNRGTRNNPKRPSRDPDGEPQQF